MSSAPQQYFARVTAGLEQLAWQDIAGALAAQLRGFGHRRIDFAYAGPPAGLLGLRSVDDIYVQIARLSGLDHTRASLARLAQKAAQLDFAPALAACAAVRPIAAQPSYRVTASHLGKRNYSRYDVEAALAEPLPWRFVPNDPEEPEPDLDLRVLLEDDWALLGLRLGDAPLHRRAYKQASRPGSLKAPVAYCLCLLAAPAPAALLLDPACGAGTILAEATALITTGALLGGDLDAAALATAQANLAALGLDAPISALDHHTAARLRAHAGPAALLYQGDAADLALADQSVDAVVTNLPWGQQVAHGSDLLQLYQAVLRTIARVLVGGGRAVLLTDQGDELLAALGACPELGLASSQQISLFGRHPTIYVIRKD